MAQSNILILNSVFWCTLRVILKNKVYSINVFNISVPANFKKNFIFLDERLNPTSDVYCQHTGKEVGTQNSEAIRFTPPKISDRTQTNHQGRVLAHPEIMKQVTHSGKINTQIQSLLFLVWDKIKIYVNKVNLPLYRFYYIFFK